MTRPDDHERKFGSKTAASFRDHADAVVLGWI
jgi:hypothetical protein